MMYKVLGKPRIPTTTRVHSKLEYLISYSLSYSENYTSSRNVLCEQYNAVNFDLIRIACCLTPNARQKIQRTSPINLRHPPPFSTQTQQSPPISYNIMTIINSNSLH